MMAETYRDQKAKPYTKPVLTVYGKVQELTQARFTSGDSDGGADPRQRTGLT
jgi:hypothetical protein